MKKITQIAIPALFLLLSHFAAAAELPGWVFKSSQKEGDSWLFSGSAYNISLLNVAIPLARNAAIANLATNIGIKADATVVHKVEGSEVDGYTQSISVSQGYFLDRIVAYGIRQKEMHIERVNDNSTGRVKFNVHILLEVSEADLKRAREDFAGRAYQERTPEPILKPKEKPGFFKKFFQEIRL